MRFSVDEVLAKLPLPATDKWKRGVWDTEPFKKNQVSLVFFAPEKEDFQTFHDQDEYYFIARGSGTLVIGNELFPAKAGDAFFVAAEERHHFEDFTDDFATWAVFF